jgi:predicted GIY-YIG superfamily endonuclease
MTEAWTVYMHTCPNNKRYVGITSKKPEVRIHHWLTGQENAADVIGDMHIL